MQTILANWAFLLETSPALWISVVFVFGLLVGSFLNVVIHRVPIMLEREWRAEAEFILAPKPAADAPEPDPASEPPRYNLITPRSACTKCGALITATQNIPVISYLILGGKCAHCRTPIAVRYPLVELASAALSAAIAWKFGFGWPAVAALVFTWMLIAASMIDLDHKLLPDDITLPLMWMGLLLALAGPSSSSTLPIDLRSAVIGAATGYLSLWMVNKAYELVTRRQGMGNGDFKLLAALGAWMGWQKLLPIILLSAVAGSLVGVVMMILQGRDRRFQIPFGPFLAVAGWIALLWGDSLIAWYLRFSRVTT
jgi:leader peptidase (prepilin peptidase)/N-methyltransferase